MHELSVVQGLFERLAEEVKPYGDCRVTLVRLRVGVLSGVVPELLRSAFEACRKGTFAESAVLEIDVTKPVFRCRACGGESFREELDYSCAKCGSRDVELVSGDELILEKLEVETDQ